MKLLIDAGNTRIKWWLQGTELSGAVASAKAETLVSEIVAVLDKLPEPEAVAVSCVAGEVVEQSLRITVARAFKVQAVFATVTASLAGVQCAYKKIDSLGVDRWLATVAAYNLNSQKACVVIDAGSAVTVDFVTSAGQHLGGLILPGKRLMAESLLSQTHGVAVNELELPSHWRPGLNTLDCVEQGLAAGFSGLMREVCSFCEQQLHEQGGLPAIFLTGGDSSWLRAFLPPTVRHEEMLVMQGLLHLPGIGAD